ncbi:hypothetical protein QBC45DRAFT_411257 [Copromyces sp. CBS 386.78]|nr:hypothetical protein QBC45DRAFT_411257 [Copromyces sp. CBS 386.78]
MALVFLGWDPGMRLAWCLFLAFFAFFAVVRNYAGRMLGWDNPGGGGRTRIKQVQICRLRRNADLKGQRAIECGGQRKDGAKGGMKAASGPLAGWPTGAGQETALDF